MVHRDIKPENVLLHEGVPMVMDFGIARAVTTAGDARITETGIAVGTPAYMSPEQSTGERDVDARSDVYSLACVTYEMLVGEPPFVAPNAQALIARRLTETPRPVRATRDVPRDVDAAIMKALARAPADRYPSVDAFAAALRDAASGRSRAAGNRRGVAVGIAAAAVVVLVLIGVFAIRGRSAAPKAAAGPPRVAVLPFENLGSAADEPFTAGVTEEITTRLAEISGLRVVSRTSAKRFAKTAATMKEVGAALNADYVLEGTVRTDRAAGGTGAARVTPQLIRVSDDVHVWEQPFDAAIVPGEIFRVQADIASKVAAAMNVTLLAREKGRVARAATSDTAAYRLYQLGRYQWEKRTPESLALAKQYFRQAIERDPTFAAAYAGLGDATFIRAFTVDPDHGHDDAVQAIAALRRAVALDSGLAEGWAGLGYTLSFANWEWSNADSAFRRAIALDPTYAPARYWYAQLLAITGSTNDALIQVREAVNLDPLSAVAHFNLAAIAASAGRHDEALPSLERAVELQADYRIPLWPLSVEYARRGQREKAEDALRRFVAPATPAQPVVDARVIRDVIQAIATRRDTSMAVARLVTSASIDGNALAAWMFAVAGDRDSAFARLRAAVATHSLQSVAGLGNAEPLLKDDPRWPDLLRSVGLTSRP